MGKNCSCYLASWYAQTNVTHSSGLPPEKPSVTFTEVAQHKNVPASSSFKHPPLFLFNIYVLSRLDCVLWGRVNPGKIKAELISSWDSPGMVPKRHLWRQKAEPSDHELWGGGGADFNPIILIPDKVNFLSTIKGCAHVTSRTYETSMLEEDFNLGNNEVMPGLMISAKNIDHIIIKY